MLNGMPIGPPFHVPEPKSMWKPVDGPMLLIQAVECELTGRLSTRAFQMLSHGNIGQSANDGPPEPPPGVEVAVAVRVGVGVRVGVFVRVGVRVGVAVRVAVAVRVFVGVRVRVGGRVGVRVFVGVREGVAVGGGNGASAA